MKLHQLTIAHVNKFILGGKSTITIKSLTTGKHFTYMVKKAKTGTLYFVSAMVGRDNESDFAYIGFINKGQFVFGNKSKLSIDEVIVQAFATSYNKYITNEIAHNKLEFFHSGKCSMCNRKLTNPESLETGIGPECGKGNRKAKRAA